MVPTQGITWLFSCPNIIPNNINLRQERNSEDKELLKSYGFVNGEDLI